MDAKDVIDIQVTVASLEVADELAEALLAARAIRGSHATSPRDVAAFDRRSVGVAQAAYCSADPGRPTNVHIRVDGWPGQQFALLFVDWLTANPDVRSDYLALKRERAGHTRATPTPRSRGSSTPIAGPGNGRTPRVGGPGRSGGGG